MIRRATEADLDAMIDIWLHGSKIANSFMPYDFWLDRADEMRTVYLPNAETYVQVNQQGVQGFISLVDDWLAALLVHPSAQRQGYGRQLLDFAKSKRQTLSLGVYTQNHRAATFYQRAEFHVIEERLDDHTGYPELVMTWRAANSTGSTSDQHSST